jgi:hypothetical protein
MIKTVTIFATLMMIAVLFSGCGKSDVQEADAATPAHSADDGQDHSGHNH